jgi:hypothetical protein
LELIEMTSQQFLRVVQPSKLLSWASTYLSSVFQR